MENQKLCFAHEIFRQKNISSIDSVINAITHSNNQIEKKMDHMLFNLFELNPEDEEVSIFMSALSDIVSKHGTESAAFSPAKMFAEHV